MRKNNNLDFDFMDGIYDVLNSSDEIVYGDDDIIYVDDEEMYYQQEDELSWVNDVEIIGEFEEDTFNFEDLGEGYIPLPKGIQEEVQVIIIDENYVPDEYEIDLLDNYEEPIFIKEERKNIKDIVELSKRDFSQSEPAINLDEVTSITHIKDVPLEQELNTIKMTTEDDRIAKMMAREFIDNRTTERNLPGEDYGDDSEDTSWVNSPDLFGNDISVIIAENPDLEVEDFDFIDGSFEDWLRENESQDVI